MTNVIPGLCCCNMRTFLAEWLLTFATIAYSYHLMISDCLDEHILTNRKLFIWTLSQTTCCLLDTLIPFNPGVQCIIKQYSKRSAMRANETWLALKNLHCPSCNSALESPEWKQESSIDKVTLLRFMRMTLPK